MKITKRQLRRLIKEACGDDTSFHDETPVSIEAIPSPAPIVETGSSEQEMIIEMEVAQRSLEQVVESVSSAASLCPGCVPEVATQAPLMEAMVAQAEALKETLQAQIDIISESTGDVPLDILDAVTDLV